MSKKMAGIIVAGGVLLAVLGFLLHQSAGDTRKAAVVASCVGGALCVVWGVVAWLGHPRRVWVVLTGVGVMPVLVQQMLDGWVGGGAEVAGSQTGRWLLLAMVLLTLGLLMYVLHGERPPEFYQRGVAPGRKAGTSEPGGHRR
jgi:hypothetical protein